MLIVKGKGSKVSVVSLVKNLGGKNRYQSVIDPQSDFGFQLSLPL